MSNSTNTPKMSPQEDIDSNTPEVNPRRSNSIIPRQLSVDPDEIKSIGKSFWQTDLFQVLRRKPDPRDDMRLYALKWRDNLGLDIDVEKLIDSFDQARSDTRDYNNMKEIGSGSSGVVYEDVDSCVKRLKTESVKSFKELINNFCFQSIKPPPSFVRVESVNFGNKTIKMELIRNNGKVSINMQDYLRDRVSLRQPIGSEMIKKFYLEIVKAMIFLDSKQLVLGDISTRNIIITDDGFKFCDLGHLCFLGDPKPKDTHTSPDDKIASKTFDIACLQDITSKFAAYCAREMKTKLIHLRNEISKDSDNRPTLHRLTEILSELELIDFGEMCDLLQLMEPDGISY